jgi:probable F420-dependent oxidoreductase
MLPRAHAQWEEDGSLDDVRAVAVAADELGYDHMTCSEHVGIPTEVAQVRGARYWDPLATFGYLAAHTTRLRFATHVLVLGYHHPLELVKRYGTLDVVTGGRLVLGVGVGSLREEFDLLDAAFDDRGARADDALAALRASFAQREPEYHGSHYDYSGFVVDPCGIQARVPIWIGGRTARSLRRAVELGDGWAPFGLEFDEIASMTQRAASTPAWQERSVPIDVWLQGERPLDPIAAPEATAEALRAMRAAGATGVNARFVHGSRSHYLDQLAALPSIVAALD